MNTSKTNEMNELKAEYIEIMLCDLTDDVSVDLCRTLDHQKRLNEIEDYIDDGVGEAVKVTAEWDKEAVEQAKKVGYCSGRPFEA